MTFDAYLWSKEKISSLVNKISSVKNDNLSTSPGQIWSIKKLLVLDYYIDGYVTIIRKHFKNWYYVDTHCGSGLFGFEEEDLKDERFPGSPLIAAFRHSEYPFTDYLFSDIDSLAISVLNQRLRTLRQHIGNHAYNPQVRDFATSVNVVENLQRYGNAFLIFIDPQGFGEIRWDLMQRLLRIKTADIFFTFMTPFIAMNRTMAESGSAHVTTLNDFFGDNTWTQLATGDELLNRYLEKMGEFKEHIFDIPVFRTGISKLYDILIATNSTGGRNIMSDATDIMRVTSTQMMEDAMKVITRKSNDLTSWMK